jgi:hypothetical protein
LQHDDTRKRLTGVGFIGAGARICVGMELLDSKGAKKDGGRGAL